MRGTPSGLSVRGSAKKQKIPRCTGNDKIQIEHKQHNKIHEMQENLESNQNYAFTFLLHAQKKSDKRKRQHERCPSTLC